MVGRMRQAWSAMRARLERWAVVQELNGLSDRDLRDIGIERADIAILFAEPAPPRRRANRTDYRIPGTDHVCCG